MCRIWFPTVPGKCCVVSDSQQYPVNVVSCLIPNSTLQMLCRVWFPTVPCQCCVVSDSQQYHVIRLPHRLNICMFYNNKIKLPVKHINICSKYNTICSLNRGIQKIWDFYWKLYRQNLKVKFLRLYCLLYCISLWLI